jgi:hypothetical protein
MSTPLVPEPSHEVPESLVSEKFHNITLTRDWKTETVSYVLESGEILYSNDNETNPILEQLREFWRTRNDPRDPCKIEIIHSTGWLVQQDHLSAHIWQDINIGSHPTTYDFIFYFKSE